MQSLRFQVLGGSDSSVSNATERSFEESGGRDAVRKLCEVDLQWQGGPSQWSGPP